jgi:exonuclease III
LTKENICDNVEIIGGFMKIFCWNMNYWQNTSKNPKDVIEWKNKCIDFLKEKDDVDFYILQEINPIKLFEKKPNQYEFIMNDYNILYHELANELLFDGRKNNFWGNAIFYHKKYKLGNNCNSLISLCDEDKSYYGRNGIMCYEFISDKEKITIINFYNKKNYANRGYYTMLDDFEKDNELTNILKSQNNRHIIMAGDFNTGFDINHREEYNKFIESYSKYNLKNCINNYSDNFVPTYLHTNNVEYVNDFCFVKNIYNIKLMDGNDRGKELSDHYPLILELNGFLRETMDELMEKDIEPWLDTLELM